VGTFILFEQSVDGIGIWAEFTKMFGGSPRRQLLLAKTLMAANDAEPLQVSHCSRIVLG